MKFYKHKSYNEYVSAQIKKNLEKIDNIWVTEKEIRKIAELINENVKDKKFGICHGVRNGWEVKRLRQLLKIEVIGTDISPTASRFENCIQWDFHNIKNEWLNNVDFIYSNSFDHSYDPYFCLDNWMKCIKKHQGICLLHWMKTNEKRIDPADCFAGSYIEYKKLIEKKYDILNEVNNNDTRIIFVIKHRKKN